MAWIRLSDDYTDHPKFDNLSDGAFRLWHQGMGFCRRFQTDGHVPSGSLRKLKAFTPKRMTELLTPWKPGEGPLWHEAGDGIAVHDYLEWNPSKEMEAAAQLLNQHRGMFVRDKGLRQALRARDSDRCRYCGIEVNWADRKGTRGATYDHVEPHGPATLENLVISCRGCNSRKRNRNPQEAGMQLRQIESKSDLDPICISTIRSSTDLSSPDPDRKIEKPLSSLESDEIATRAGWFVGRFAELYAQERNGARYRARPNLDWVDACDLVKLWPDTRLEQLAVWFLNSGDPWISGTDRGFKIFAMKASFCDNELTAWEQSRKASAS